MLVSICINVYNKASVLQQCLDSVVNQTYSNLEIIIIDAFSTDGSWDIVKAYTSKDGRIRSYQKEIDLVRGMELAYDLATGDYIGTVDADDYIELNCVDRCLQEIGDHDVLYTQCMWVGDIVRLDHRASIPFDKDVILQFMMPFHFRLIRRSKWLEVRPFSPVRFLWDWDLVVKLSEVASFTHLPEVMYYWRRSKTQRTGNHVEEYKKDKELIKRLALLRRNRIHNGSGS